MGSEQPADFYDRAYAPTTVPLIRNPWLPIWLLACQWLEADPPKAIVDLGCGAGRFAELLWERDWRSTQFLGVDFSTASIKCARRMTKLPQGLFQFVCADIRDYDVAAQLPEDPSFSNKRPTVVCLETLEHIGDDLAVIERLPKGTRIIFSVPNWDSESHVRFMDRTAAYNRYGRLVEYRRLGDVDLSPPAGRSVAMFEGWRR